MALIITPLGFGIGVMLGPAILAPGTGLGAGSGISLYMGSDTGVGTDMDLGMDSGIGMGSDMGLGIGMDKVILKARRQSDDIIPKVRKQSV